MMFSLFGTARLNDVDPLAWFTDVLARIADIPQSRLHELLPWNWKAAQQQLYRKSLPDFLQLRAS
jgi:hypothetical protein